MTEVFYRGSKVFWKVHSTVEVIIVKHRTEEVLEVVCIDPIMSREAARLYLRLPLLLTYLNKEVSHPDQTASFSEDLKLELVNFILDHLQVTAHKAKSRTFQIEFQKDGTDFECDAPSTVHPYIVQAPGTARKEMKDLESSSRSTISNSTASVSRSSTQRTDTKGREEFVEFRESMKAVPPASLPDSDNGNDAINTTTGDGSNPPSNASTPKATTNSHHPTKDVSISAGAAILNRNNGAAAGEYIRTNSETCLPFSSKKNTPLIRMNSDPTTKDDTHDVPEAHAPAATARVSPRPSPRPPGAHISPSPRAATSATAGGFGSAGGAGAASGTATGAGAFKPHVKARRRSSVHATSTVLQALPQCDKELAPLPSNRPTHVDALHSTMTYTTHPTNPPQHALTHTPTAHNKPKPHKMPKAKGGFLGSLWCSGAAASVNSVHPHGPR